MSDLLPAIEPQTSGSVMKIDVPIGKYLGIAAEAGFHDSEFNAVMRMEGDHLNNVDKTARTLQPDEANQKYGIGDLKFTAPVKETTAQAMSERERDKMDRDLYLYSGASRGRFIPGMTAQILGATLNPLDLGTMFIPFVGEAKVARMFEMAGKPFRATIARGLITGEQIAKTGVPVHRAVEAGVQGAMWQTQAEVPKLMNEWQENQPLQIEGGLMDVVGQAAFAGAMHSAGQLLKFIGTGTRDAMSREAVNQWLKDEPVRVHDMVQLDDHVIQHQAMEQERLMREEAANRVNVEGIKRDVVKEMGEYPIDPALRSRNTGEIRTGPLHPMIEGYEHSSEEKGSADYHPDAEWLRGFVTDKGRFVSRKEADQMTGSGGDFLTAEGLQSGTSDPGWLSHEERTRFDTYKEQFGMSDAEALNKIRDERLKRREQRILANPEVQKRIENLRQQVINEYVEKQKAKLKQKDPEIQKMSQERTTPADDKHYGDDMMMRKSLDEDIEALGGKKVETKSGTVEIKSDDVKAVEAAVACILEKIA